MSSVSSSSTLTAISGSVDLTQLIPTLVAAERAPETRLLARKTTAESTASAYAALTNQVTAIQTAIAKISDATAWKPLTVSSSATGVTATTTASAGATPGSLTFSIDQVATAQSVYSSSTYASTGATVMAASGRLFVASGGRAEGIASLAPSANLPTGAHTVTVTQATGAASTTSASQLPPTTIDSGNDTVTVEVNGIGVTVTIPHGSYATAGQLAAAIQSAVQADPTAQGLRATATSDGHLRLSTTREGSAATLQVTGGSALATLGIDADASARAGTDGIVTVDGTATTVTSAEPGAAVTLAAPTGSLTATLSGGLRTGTIAGRNVDVGDGTLSSVVNAVNATDSGARAAAVQVGPGQYRLQITSTTAGADGGVNLDLAALQGTGGFVTLTEGADARITVSGANPYSITSATNTFTDVLPGVAFTLQPGATGTATVTAAQDTATLASRVQSVVQAVNTVLSSIKTASAYNAATKSVGLLNGDATVRQLASSLTTALVGQVSGAGTATATLAGVTLGKDGSVAFDATAFSKAYASDPSGVQRLFTSFGRDTANPGVLERLGKAATAATSYSSGTLRAAEASERSKSKRLQAQVDSMEVRIAAYQAGLQTRFAALNSTLSSLTSQKSWLASQISSLG